MKMKFTWQRIKIANAKYFPGSKGGGEQINYWNCARLNQLINLQHKSSMKCSFHAKKLRIANSDYFEWDKTVCELKIIIKFKLFEISSKA